LVASDFGITAHLPYLKQLIRSYNTHESRVKRIHLVWQVQNIEIATGIQPILNKALDEDRLNDGYNLNVSIYHTSLNKNSLLFGGRVKMYPSEAPIRDIIDAELKKRCVKKTVVQDIDWHARGIESGFEKAYEKVGGMVISSTESIRDEARKHVASHLTDDVSYFELDYQPS
ncbi:hypothetical protein BS50DRAFT_510287, partial [Corynespora cassiicola Philippines]